MVLMSRMKSKGERAGFARVVSMSSRWLLLSVVMGISWGCGEQGDPDQGPKTLEDYSGYIVFVNYWAEWCTPCRREIPALNEFQDSHPAQVRVVGVNFDGVTGEALAVQEQQLGIRFPTLDRDPRSQLGLAPPQGLPETLVFNPGGELVLSLAGEQTLGTLQEALEKAIERNE